MVYSAQNRWVCGLCPSSGIPKNATFRKLDVSIFRWRKVDNYSVGALRKRLRLAFPKGPNRVGVCLFTWGRKQTQFPKGCIYLEVLAVDKSTNTLILYTGCFSLIKITPVWVMYGSSVINWRSLHSAFNLGHWNPVVCGFPCHLLLKNDYNIV
jgi:hypothetical protein